MSHRLIRIARTGLLAAVLVVPVSGMVSAQQTVPAPAPTTTDYRGDRDGRSNWGLLGLIGLLGLGGLTRRESNHLYRSDRPVTRPGT